MLSSNSGYISGRGTGGALGTPSSDEVEHEWSYMPASTSPYAFRTRTRTALLDRMRHVSSHFTILQCFRRENRVLNANNSPQQSQTFVL